MTWRAGVGCAAVVTSVLVVTMAARTTGQASAPQLPQTGQSVFRTAADLVTIDVSVRTSGTPVGGLSAEQFVLLDNGVPQHVDSVEMEAVPADITIIVDTSDAMSEYIDTVNSQLQQIAAMARPDDQLRVMAVGSYVTEIFPMQRAATHPPVERLTISGLSSIHDAMGAALVRAVEPNRRHLVIVLSDTIDTMSTLSAQDVRDIARQSSATLHIAWITMAETDSRPPIWTSNRERLAVYKCSVAQRCGSGARFWAPFREAPSARMTGTFPLLREAAELTGGALHEGGLFQDRSASGIFKKVYEDYRREYVLRYVPQGVKREGWHAISVTIPAYPSYNIQTRRGYAIEAGAPVPVATQPAIPATPARPAPLGVVSLVDRIVGAYGRGDFAAARAWFSAAGNYPRTIADFLTAGNPWPATPRLEAVLVLELADAALATHRADANEAARDLLTTYGKLVRDPLEPDEFERAWLAAELAILQGAVQPAMAQPFVENALARFPDEPRFHLAQAIITDQKWPLGMQDQSKAFGPPRLRDVMAQYDAAIDYDSTALEARVRGAWFLHRLGRDLEALALLDEAKAASGDAGMTYLRQLFRGYVLDALGRSDEALADYRAAFALWPSAQSARIALMNSLARRGERAEARILADAVQTLSGTDVNPWWLYWQGDYRFFPGIIAQLRERAR